MRINPDKVHPKASVPGFYDDDYKETLRYEENGILIVHSENSAGREMVVGTPIGDSKEIPFRIFPGGGCNNIGYSVFCSFGHIDWKIPPEVEKARAQKFKGITNQIMSGQ